MGHPDFPSIRDRTYVRAPEALRYGVSTEQYELTRMDHCQFTDYRRVVASDQDSNFKRKSRIHSL